MLHTTRHELYPSPLAQESKASLTVWQVALVFAGAVAVCYLPALNGPFIFDDFLNLVNSPQIRSLVPNEHSWRESRPVGFYTFALNYALHGLRPAGFRAVNMLIHLAAGITLFVLIRDTLRGFSADAWRWKADRIAFGAALLWLVHPLQTAAVTCIVQRFESLMALCFLLVLLALQKSATSEKRLAWQACAVICFWLGMGCKEVMATCLPVALLYDRLFLTQSWQATLRNRGGAYAAMLLSFVWLGWAISGSYASGANATAGFGISQVSAWEYLRSQPAVILHYLRLSAWPNVLCLDYGWPIETSVGRIYGFGAIILTLLVLSLVLLVRRPAIGFLGLSFFLVLAPTSSVMPIADLAFEHRMYLPLAALAILFAVGIEATVESAVRTKNRLNFAFGPHSGPYLILLIALPLALRTAARNVEYRDPERIWLGAIEVNPQHARSHFLLAEHLVRVHRDDDAVARYREAVEVRPHYIAAYNNAALALERLNRIAEAQAMLNQAIAIAPQDPYLHFNLGRMLAKQSDWQAARQAYEKTLQLAPHYAAAKKQLAAVLAQQQAMIVPAGFSSE